MLTTEIERSAKTQMNLKKQTTQIKPKLIEVSYRQKVNKTGQILIRIMLAQIQMTKV